MILVMYRGIKQTIYRAHSIRDLRICVTYMQSNVSHLSEDNTVL